MAVSDVVLGGIDIVLVVVPVVLVEVVLVLAVAVGRGSGVGVVGVGTLYTLVVSEVVVLEIVGLGMFVGMVEMSSGIELVDVGVA